MSDAVPQNKVALVGVLVVIMGALLTVMFASGYLFVGSPSLHRELYEVVKKADKKDKELEKNKKWWKFCRDDDKMTSEMRSLIKDIRSGDYYDDLVGSLVKSIQGEIKDLPDDDYIQKCLDFVDPEDPEDPEGEETE